MAYCSTSDLIKRIPEQELIQLTDDAGAGVINAGIVTAAVAAADGKIDSYIRNIYTVPLASVPELVKQISIDLALFNLFTRRFQTGDIPQAVVLRHNDALADLVRIQRGDVDIGATPIDDDGPFLTNCDDDTRDITDDDWDQY
jgi:phage gp36-like protein